MSNKRYLKISELSELAGKAEVTVRKTIAAKFKENKHNDSIIAEPYRGKQVRYFVELEYAKQLFGISDQNTDDKSIDESEMIAQLRSEIAFLRKQVEESREREKEFRSAENEYRQMLGYLTKVLGEKVAEDLNVKKLK
ncbi:hypothetical protein V6R21_03270 [Limibacter armeniacum]|uniref:hypothetical protein n=1 Tax=Limibacter armeniacum TaxID=466084 RepID=UPI002FE63CC7